MYDACIFAAVTIVCVAVFLGTPKLLSTAAGIRLQSSAEGLVLMVFLNLFVSVAITFVDHKLSNDPLLDSEDEFIAYYFRITPIWYVYTLNCFPLLGSLYAFPPEVSAWASQYVIRSIKFDKAKLICVGAFISASAMLYHPFMIYWQSGEWNGMIVAVAMLLLLPFFASLLHSLLGHARKREQEKDFTDENLSLLKHVFVALRSSIVKQTFSILQLLYTVYVFHGHIKLADKPGYSEAMYSFYHENPSYIYGIGITLFGFIPASENFSIDTIIKWPSLLKQLSWDYGDTMNITARYMSILAHLICLLVCSLTLHLTSIGTGVLLYAFVVSLWTCSLIVSECRYSIGIATAFHRDYGYNPSPHLATYFDLLEEEEHVFSKTPHRVEHGPNRI